MATSGDNNLAVDNRPGRWWNRAGLEGEVKLLALGGVRITRSADDSTRKADLDQAIAALERSDRAARWYTEDAIQPGQWVHFEARLNYRVMDEDNFLSTVIFIDHPRGNEVNTEVRLLLHGSPEHLLGRHPRTLDLPLEVRDHERQQRRVSVGDASSGLGWVEQRWVTKWVEVEVVDLLSTAALKRAVRKLSEKLGRHHSIVQVGDDATSDRFDRTVKDVVRRLDGELSPITSAWMAGYARVTAIVPCADYPADPLLAKRILVATPLYVQYVSAPGPEYHGLP